MRIWLWILFLTSLGALWFGLGHSKPTNIEKEGFVGFVGGGGGVSLQQMSTDALDRAPSTSEVKDDYKKLLIYADVSIRRGGDDAVKALRVLADLRDRLFDIHDFRENLVVDDFISNWPDWLTPLDTTISETGVGSDYTCADAATSEAHVLAFLQKNYPQAKADDDNQTGFTVRRIIEDFGYRFVFKRGDETVELAKGFLTKPLLRGWVSPCQVHSAH